MEANPDFSMCFHPYKILKDGVMLDPSPEKPHDYSPDELVAYQLKGYDIHTSTRMFRNLYRRTGRMSSTSAAITP